jgi:hypothetical protein
VFQTAKFDKNVAFLQLYLQLLKEIIDDVYYSYLLFATFYAVLRNADPDPGDPVPF